jgi:hypothetical protein
MLQLCQGQLSGCASFLCMSANLLCININSTALACLLHMGGAMCMYPIRLLVNRCIRAGATCCSGIVDKCLDKYSSVNTSSTPITAACLLVHVDWLSGLTAFDVLRLCMQERAELRQQSHARRAHLLYHRCHDLCRNRRKAGFDPRKYGKKLHLAFLQRTQQPQQPQGCAGALTSSLYSHVHSDHVLSDDVSVERCVDAWS